MKHQFGLIIFFASLLIIQNFPQSTVIENFEDLSNIKKIFSDGAKIEISLANNHNGKCLKIDYEFFGAGYCGIERIFRTKLPQDYKFSFYTKGNSPKNNLEFKLVDKTGDNVWWKNQRYFEFPSEWQKITIKKRNIEFAWGPMGGGEAKEIESLQIIIASAEGGSGTIYLDQLNFEEIAQPKDPSVKPIISSFYLKDRNLNNLADNNFTTRWQSKRNSERQTLLIDFQFIKEIGGFVFHWDEFDFARDFEILISNNRVDWERVFLLNHNNLSRNIIFLPDVDARYVKINLTRSSRKKGYILKEIEIKDAEFSKNYNAFFSNVAQYYMPGYFPKYFLNKQSYWTVVGVSEDLKEALINQQGTIEVDKACFSVEPFIQLNDELITWNDVQINQTLEKEYLPLPHVKWIHPSFNMEITALADGDPGSSNLLIKYSLTNTSKTPITGKLYLSFRPFQVNPKWQFLNNEGGVTKIKSIKYSDSVIQINNDKIVIPLTIAENFGATDFYHGEIIDYLIKQKLPTNQFVKDDFGFASASLCYNFILSAGESKEYFLLVPFHQLNSTSLNEARNNPSNYFSDRLQNQISFWKEKLDNIKIQLPASGDKIIKTMKSYLAYILINKDGPAIQPGSRSYERSWIRDGALTSSALLRLGLKDEVRNFLDWYSRYQFPSGKIPCVVDKRGADPTAENDSHGEYIYAVLQFFKFTHDTAFLAGKLQNIIGAVNYIEFLTNQRKTDQYAKPDSIVFWGLVPESISHEGYSAKPMHSYWDNFFTLRGLRDAIEITDILGETELKKRYEILRDDFEKNLLNSLKRAIQNHNIDYIPGCAELGDFDATSTTIALFPCNEQKRLPQKELLNTFEIYYSNSLKRMQKNSDWKNYTPYELRVIGSFVLLNQRERAHKMLDFFFEDQRPKVWNHWAEVVWKNIDEPQFIGDMPHTWVGSDFINSIRTMLIYEDELDSSLVLGAGLKNEWIESGKKIIVSDLPTYYGNVNYSIEKKENYYELTIGSDLIIPKNAIVFKNFKDTTPTKVFINDKESDNFNINEIIIKSIPAVVRIEY